MGLTPPITPRLDDPDLERIRREHDAKIRELQALPATSTRILDGIELADGVVTPIAHGLGRRPRIVLVSPPRSPSTSGRIEELRISSYDPTRYVVLEANGYGATVTVDVEVK